MESGAVGAGQTAVAQRQIVGMDPNVGMRQPAGGLSIGHTRQEALGYRRRCRLGAGFQPRHGVLGTGEGGQQGMAVIGLRKRSARTGMARRLKPRNMVDFPDWPEPVLVFFGSLSGHFCRSAKWLESAAS